jgi:5-methylcytosine-specific restriction endonuclease McrA
LKSQKGCVPLAIFHLMIKKSKGLCASSSCSLNDNETTVELHHVHPKEYNGPLTRLNKKALCKECHTNVSAVV